MHKKVVSASERRIDDWKGPGGADKDMTWPGTQDETKAPQGTFASHGPTRDTFEKERFGHQAPHKEDEEEEKKWRAEEETKREEMRKEIPDQEPVVEAHKERVYDPSVRPLTSQGDMIKAFTSMRLIMLSLAVAVFVCLLCVPSKTVLNLLSVLGRPADEMPNPKYPAYTHVPVVKRGVASSDDEYEESSADAGTPRELMAGEDGQSGAMLSSLNDVNASGKTNSASSLVNTRSSASAPRAREKNPVVSMPTDAFYQGTQTPTKSPRRGSGSNSPRHSYV